MVIGDVDKVDEMKERKERDEELQQARLVNKAQNYSSGKDGQTKHGSRLRDLYARR